MQYFRDILDFAFPRNCVVCGRLLNDTEPVICSFCYYELPRTNFHEEADNPVAKLFWGRVPVVHATAFFYFNKGGAYQKLIHGLKYGGRMDIGIETGRMFGVELRPTVFYDAELIIPVPLHPRKLRIRGYNQSEMIARGMGKVLNKPVITNILERKDFTATQTRKSRFDRFSNVSGSFLVKNAETCRGRHILLVDDVVTTGSTLEACAEVLLKGDVKGVSIATLAVA